MKIRNIYTIIILLSLFWLQSCKEFPNTTTNTSEKQEDCKKQLAVRDSVIFALSNKLSTYTNRVDSLEMVLKVKNINSDYLNFLINQTKFLSDIGETTQVIVDELELKDRNVMSQMWNNGFPVTGREYYRNESENNSKIKVVNNLWNTIDRSEDTLENIFTNNAVQKIIQVFQGNSIYEDSGLSSIVKAMLLTYNQVQINGVLKPEFSQIKNDLYLDRNYYDNIELVNSQLASDDVINMLSDENYTTTKNYSSSSNRVFYVYTFWCRRFKEGNQKFVYRIMKKIDQELSYN